MVVHLIYPHGESISCPDAIGRNLATRLRRRFDVIQYDWVSFGKIRPGRADILVGHACPLPLTIFRRSCRQENWRRVILMAPYCHGDDYQAGFNEHVVPYCDLFLAITGNHWFSSVGRSGFSHWLPKMRHLDLAVDRGDFPVIKTSFNAPGKRRFVYIGHDAWYKNVPYLASIAREMPQAEFAWIGSGKPLAGLVQLGRMDFRLEQDRRKLAAYDFLITAGNADGNPATILEAMAWGLVPVCTPESGYCGFSSIPAIPLSDVAGAVRILQGLQDAPDSVLRSFQQVNWSLLDNHFNWDRFASIVVKAIESNESPPCNRAGLWRRLQLAGAEIRSPHWRDYLHPSKLQRRLKKAWRATTEPYLDGRAQYRNIL